MPTDNPFERWGIDPEKGPAAITERMRELAEEAPDEATRAAIRAAWEELTLHPARRFRAAVRAHPDSHGLVGGAPPRPARRAQGAPPVALDDLLLRPSLLEALGLVGEARRPLPDLDPEDDPLLDQPSRTRRSKRA